MNYYEQIDRLYEEQEMKILSYNADYVVIKEGIISGIASFISHIVEIIKNIFSSFINFIKDIFSSSSAQDTMTKKEETQIKQKISNGQEVNEQKLENNIAKVNEKIENNTKSDIMGKQLVLLNREVLNSSFKELDSIIEQLEDIENSMDKIKNKFSSTEEFLKDLKNDINGMSIEDFMSLATEKTNQAKKFADDNLEKVKQNLYITKSINGFDRSILSTLESEKAFLKNAENKNYKFENTYKTIVPRIEKKIESIKLPSELDNSEYYKNILKYLKIMLNSSVDMIKYTANKMMDINKIMLKHKTVLRYYYKAINVSFE